MSDETCLYPRCYHPWDLEPYYSRHVAAMTAEGLHAKSAIAEQLAWRDKQLAESERRLTDADSAYRNLFERYTESERKLAESVAAHASTWHKMKRQEENLRGLNEALQESERKVAKLERVIELIKHIRRNTRSGRASIAAVAEEFWLLFDAELAELEKLRGK